MNSKWVRLCGAVMAIAVVAGCGGSEAKDSGAAAPVTVTVTEAIEEAPTEQPVTTEAEEPEVGVTDRRYGQQATDGSISFRVVSVTRVDSIPQDFDDPLTAPAGASLIAVKVSYRNDGRVEADPFCGGRGIVLIDTQERNFDPNDTAAISVPGNNICGGTQPGFRSAETVPFTLPRGAKVAAVGVWDPDDEEDFDGSSSWLRFSR